MRKFKFLSLLLVFSVAISLIPFHEASALDSPEVGANTVLLLDMASGDELFSRNPDGQVAPASLTKIMTVLLAVEAIENGQVTTEDRVTVSENVLYDLIDDGSTAGIEPGEEMSLLELMYCAMVVSANEACNAIAEYIGGSIPAFIDMMNAKAVELECMGTHFANAHGLPNDNHYTTARDMSLITQDAIDRELFLQICSTPEIEIPPTNIESEPRTLKNTNALLGDNNYYEGYEYEYARGVKTGHTEAAGYCLISTATKDDISVLGVVMGGGEYRGDDGKMVVGSFADSITLYDWVFDNFSYKNVLDYYDASQTRIPVEMASDASSVGVRPNSSVTALLPADADASEFQFETHIYSEEEGKPLEAPVSKGEILGEVVAYKSGRVIGSMQLEAASDISMSKMVFLRTQISSVFSSRIVRFVLLGLLIFAVLYILLVVRYNILRSRHVASVRRAQREREAMRQGNYLQMDEQFFNEDEQEQEHVEPPRRREPEYAGRHQQAPPEQRQQHPRPQQQQYHQPQAPYPQQPQYGQQRPQPPYNQQQAQRPQGSSHGHRPGADYTGRQQQNTPTHDEPQDYEDYFR